MADNKDGEQDTTERVHYLSSAVDQKSAPASKTGATANTELVLSFSSTSLANFAPDVYQTATAATS